MRPSSTLHFGPFYFDGTDDGLWRGPQRCQLTAKASAVLRYLVEHPNRLVRRTTLMAAVWPDVHVSDWALTTCIREIRHVLGDVAKAPRYIETVHRQGYRFIAPVTVADTLLPLSISEAPPPPLRSAPLAPELSQPPPTAAVPDEEHKLVTVLCGALADAPPLAARLGPERQYRLLQTIIGLVQEVLHPYGGTLTLATSAGFTAIFGAPLAQEDHARLAVSAALELRQRLHDCPALRAQLAGEVLAPGMGLHSGLVVVGSLGMTRSDSPRRLESLSTWRRVSSSRLPRPRPRWRRRRGNDYPDDVAALDGSSVCNEAATGGASVSWASCFSHTPWIPPPALVRASTRMVNTTADIDRD